MKTNFQHVDIEHIFNSKIILP